MSFLHVHHLPPPRAIDTRVRVLNVRFLIVSVAAFFVLLLTLRKWHDRQVTRHADALLVSVDEAAGRSDWKEIELRLARYLKLRPDDVDAMARYADAKAKASLTRADRIKAIAAYLDLLRIDPARQDCWLPVARLQLSIGMPKEALGAVSQFLERTPSDPAALLLCAAATDQLHGIDESISMSMVIAAHRNAVLANPDDIGAASRLAYLLESINDADGSSTVSESGIAVMNRLVERCQNKGRAHFARYLFRRHSGNGRSEGAAADLALAEQLAPDDPEIQYAVVREQLEAMEGGTSFRSNRDSDPMVLSALKARLTSLKNDHPSDPRPYYMLASYHELLGAHSEAIAVLQEGREAIGDNATLLEGRLAELSMTMGAWEAAAVALRRLESQKSSAIPSKDGDPLQTPTAMADRLWADWYRADDNPQMDLDAAAARLARLAKLRLPRETFARISRDIGDCHFSLGDWDLATEAYQRAIAADPTDTIAWIGLAETYRRRGQVALALERYRHVLSVSTDPQQVGAVRVAIAQLELLRQLSTPSSQRRWGELEEALRQATRAIPSAPALLFLHLQEELTRQGHTNDEATAAKERIVAVLTEKEELYGHDPAFWRSAFSWHWRFGVQSAALRALENLEAISGQKAFPERVRIALAEGGYSRAQPLIIEARDSMNRCQFSIFMTSIARDLRDEPQAMAWIEGFLVLDPDNLRLRGVLAELAAYASDMTQLQKCHAELTRLDGTDGPYALWSKIQLSLFRARLGDTRQMFWARADSRKLFALRPQWSLSIATLGTVAELDGRMDEAISHYGDAFRSDQRDVRLIAKYLALLTLHGRGTEARTVLRSLPDSLRAMPELLSLSVHLEIEAGATAVAIRLARLAIANAPQLAQPHWQLGLALLADRSEESETAAARCFLDATKAEPGDMTAWIARLWNQLRGNHPDRTAAVLETLQSFSVMFRTGPDAIGPEDQDYLLARCAQLDGNLSLANQMFRRSIRRRGSQFKHPLPTGTVYSLELAEGSEMDVRDLLTEMSPPARQSFGLLIATEPDAIAESAAQTFLEGDARLSALAAIARGGPDELRRALSEFDRLSPGEIQRGDCLVIATVLTQLGRARDAIAELRKLRHLEPTPEQLQQWAALSLALSSVADAAAALELLGNSEPADFTTISLRVRLLHAQHRHDDAVALTLEAGLTVTQRAELLTSIGERERGLGFLRAAFQVDPAAGIDYARLLGREAETFEQAVQVLKGSLPAAGPFAVGMCATELLSHRRGTAEDRQQLNELVKTALTLAPHASQLLRGLAIARENEGDYPAALRLIKEALQEDSQDAAALNNYAWLTANYQGEVDAALTLLRTAMKRCGPEVEILDTLAITALAQRRDEEAIRLLEFCTRWPIGAAPNAAHLHLAEAYAAQGRRQEARRIIEMLHTSRFQPSNPRDQSAIARLEQTLYTEGE